MSISEFAPVSPPGSEYSPEDPKRAPTHLPSPPTASELLNARTPPFDTTNTPESLPDVPLPVHKRSKVAKIIRDQFDLEILLKHREMRTIDQQIARVEIMMVKIRQWYAVRALRSSENSENLKNSADLADSADSIKVSASASASESVNSSANPSDSSSANSSDSANISASAPTEPSEFAEKYAYLLSPAYLSAQLQALSGLPNPSITTNINPYSTNISHPSPPHSYPATPLPPPQSGPYSHSHYALMRTRSQTCSLRPTARSSGAGFPSAQCIVRRADGTLVQLICPDAGCRRSNFSSPQGFINHCRIAHGREIMSHTAAARECGVPVAEVAEAAFVAGKREPGEAGKSGKDGESGEVGRSGRNGEKTETTKTVDTTEAGNSGNSGNPTEPPKPTKETPNFEALFESVRAKVTREATPDPAEAGSPAAESAQAMLVANNPSFARTLAEARKLSLDVDQILEKHYGGLSAKEVSRVQAATQELSKKRKRRKGSGSQHNSHTNNGKPRSSDKTVPRTLPSGSDEPRTGELVGINGVCGAESSSDTKRLKTITPEIDFSLKWDKRVVYEISVKDER